jgi:two-component system cell cycle sensor histidine kinase/response regulator CckA
MDNEEILKKRHVLKLGLRLFNTLTTLNVWHFLWISIVLSEVLTALMGLLLKGSVTYDYLVTGGVVSLIVAGIVIFFLKVTMQVRVDNQILQAEVEKQRETTEDLTKALGFQSLLMETIPDLLYVLNPVGALIKWNRLVEQTTGYTREDLEGKHALIFIAKEDRDLATAGLEEAYLKGKASRELRLLTKGGKKVVHLFSGASIRDEDGRFMGYVGTARDISKLKKMEEEMNRAQKLESLGILASGIANDFNFLLSSVLENIHLSVINADQRERLRETLLKAQQEAVRAKDLTRQLLTFSRGSLPVKKFAALGEIVTEYAALALGDSDVICRYDIPADLWAVKVDEEQIGQVINTLVLNSTEAMPEGGNITITAENKEVSSDELPPLPEGRYVKISVADNGRGIPQELLRKIFDPYFTTKQDGRGLGLTISYAIIRNHDGHISVESEPNKGAVFHIYLPTSP